MDLCSLCEGPPAIETAQVELRCFGNNIGQTLENYINPEETDNIFCYFWVGGRKSLEKCKYSNAIFPPECYFAPDILLTKRTRPVLKR